MLLPDILAAPIGCTAVIVGIAAASDPRLRTRASSPLFAPALVAVGAALALGPAIDTWFSDLDTGWFVLQVVLVLAAVGMLVSEGRRAGYGLPATARQDHAAERRPPGNRPMPPLVEDPRQGPHRLGPPHERPPRRRPPQEP